MSRRGRQLRRTKLCHEQIVSSAPVDVFFSANEATMQSVVDAGLAADPEVLVTNTLEIAVPAGNPRDHRSRRLHGLS